MEMKKEEVNEEMKKYGLVLGVSKVSPRISIRFGARGIALTVIITHVPLFQKYYPKLRSILYQTGPVDKLAAKYRSLGDVAYVQSNVAECIALGSKAPSNAFSQLCKEFLKEISKTKPSPPPQIISPKAYSLSLNTVFNPTTTNPAFKVFVVVDKKIGLIFGEFVYGVKQVVEAGTKTLEAIKRSLERKTPTKAKLTEWKGKLGYWVTTKTGRRVFIPKDKVDAYHDWREGALKSLVNFGGITAGAGLLLSGIGVASGAVHAAVKDNALMFNLFKKGFKQDPVKALKGASWMAKNQSDILDASRDISNLGLKFGKPLMYAGATIGVVAAILAAVYRRRGERNR